MEERECPRPLLVEGDWAPGETKTLKNKLHIYFQSSKKSGGGDCRVEAEDGARRVAVFFRSDEVRERVLARDHHEITVGKQTLKLQLISPASPGSSNDNAVTGSEVQTSAEGGAGEAGGGAFSVAAAAAAASDAAAALAAAVAAPAGWELAAHQQDCGSAPTTIVLLENVPHNMHQDLLLMLVESVSGLDESSFTLEVIWDSNRAVVVFNNPAEAEKFVTVSRTSEKMEKHKLTAQLLNASRSIQVEGLPCTVVKDLLELYFDKNWALPENIVMIPEEQAAIISFSDPKVVERIGFKEDYMIGSIPVKMYPYNEFLGTALYGKKRPAIKIPETFTVSVHPKIWKFLHNKKQCEVINDQMRPHFCSVDFANADVKLMPLAKLMRQKGLTAKHTDKWMSTAQMAFNTLMSQYLVFDCPMNAHAWKAAEKDVRSVVRDDMVLMMHTAKQVLSVAGKAEDINRIRAPVENIALKAMSQSQRQKNAISHELNLSRALYYILMQSGLDRASQDISPEMKLSYNEDTQKLTICGLLGEVDKMKSWILDQNVRMTKKAVIVPFYLVEFLKSVDAMDMSQDLFTSQRISAMYNIEKKGVLLMGSSDSVLAEAESKMKTALSVDTLQVEDQNVLKLPTWMDLNRKLLDTYNSAKKQTVAVQIDPGKRTKVIVAGFVNPVKEVSRNLREFLMNNAHIQDTIRLQSCAIVQFIEKKRFRDFLGIAKANAVFFVLESERPKLKIRGPRVHVQRAKHHFQELISTLSTDSLIVDKPGAKKYFQSQGALLLPQIMADTSCEVVLSPDNQEEEEEESYEEVSGLVYCQVQTTHGTLISVCKADICSFSADAVVNAANEDLNHIGGLALALLKAAGPQLQKISNDYIAQNGRLRPGDAITTKAGNLPCKYVIHAVGPRFSDADKRTSVSRLKLAVKESLKQAEMVNCSTIALPAISSGVFGFPVDLCAETIAQALWEFCNSPLAPTSVTEIHLVDNNSHTVRILAKAVNHKFIDLGPIMTEPKHAGRRPNPTTSGRSRGQGVKSPHKSHTFGEREHGKGGGHEGSGRMEQVTAEGLKIALARGNIEEQTTDVIINTISNNMNLNQGAVSKAILEAAGPGLQLAVQATVGVPVLKYGDVVVTSGLNLACRELFHTVCPFWDYGGGEAEKILRGIVTHCLDLAEQHGMASLSCPAIGSGNLSFPRDVVSRVLLSEIHSYSRRKSPRHLREVVIVVHPSDSNTVESFNRVFKGQTAQGNVQHEEQTFTNDFPVFQKPLQPSQSAASISRVSSPALGVYQMKIGQLTFEVSSGDITKETSDVIINSSNQSFNLKSGVSKAILDAAGLTVEQECSQIVSAPGYQPKLMILTTAGLLPSKAIIHIIGQNDHAKIKDIVLKVLKFCEEHKFVSIAFPALGTGQGGANPTSVAEAMVDAVVEFVRKKHQKIVQSVKILIFQTAMMAEFHKCMMKRGGEELEGKSVLSKIKDSFTSLLGIGEEQPIRNLVLKEEEFEPTVFQLCAESEKNVSLAKKRIKDLILAEQLERTISDPYISQLSQEDLDQLRAMQRKLTVSIRLDKGFEDQEPKIHLQGLTRDVLSADSSIRDIIRRVERSENLKSKAVALAKQVEWHFQDHNGVAMPFDIYINLKLEEALQKQQSVNIKIQNQKFTAFVTLNKAVSANGSKEVELLRKDLKANDNVLPAHWDDMKSDLLKVLPVTVGSQEYLEVEKEFKKTGHAATVIKIERIQNSTLWQSYQLLKKQLEVKNKHTNNEKELFHGTDAKAIDLINSTGFNRSYAGQHGAVYGNGTYFAVDPKYSANGYANPDANGHKRVYLARVLVGDFTKGKQGLIAPPSKGSGNAVDLYDSVVDNTTNPTIFVVFNDIQAYPEYIITFI